MAGTRSTNTIPIITPNTNLADTQSINTIRITTLNTIRTTALNTRTLRLITVRIKATSDRTPILQHGPIVSVAVFHAENAA
jgi:hypothetical protein